MLNPNEVASLLTTELRMHIPTLTTSVPGWTRTSYLLLRRESLYPDELQGPIILRSYYTQITTCMRVLKLI